MLYKILQMSERVLNRLLVFSALLATVSLVRGVQEPDPIDRPPLKIVYASRIDRKLALPVLEQERYGQLALTALSSQDAIGVQAQYLLVVDRCPLVQAVLLYWISSDAEPYLVGASPAATGKPGKFEYFETPLGVFEHTIDNPDFRAKGTRNQYGVRGYGAKGMRVFDFGWVPTPRGWGDGHKGKMRLQVHATDPDLFEPKLGIAASKGCIRIPATLNSFLDHYGILDADYERAIADGKKFFVLLPDRETTPWPGNYLVVVDTKRQEHPSWSPLPKR